MKKIFVLAILLITVLSGCNSSTLSFSKIEKVPNKVQDKVDPNLELQSIYVVGKGYYIVFHSRGDVEGDIETQGEKITIKFEESNERNDVLKQHTFYLTTDPEHDMIEVMVNGESTPFDSATGFE